MPKLTFKKDGKREKRCPRCTAYLGMMHLGEKKTATVRCKDCGYESEWRPPQKVAIDGERKIEFGPPGNDSIFTADLTT